MEIVPVEGDYESLAYSSVAEVVRYCEQLGIPRDLWPIDYGVSCQDIPLREVGSRCKQLRNYFDRVITDDPLVPAWLPELRQWLSEGQIFCIQE